MSTEEDDLSDLFTCDDFNMDCTKNSDESIHNEISRLQNANSIEDKLESAKKLVSNVMPTTSIIVVENKILKHLLPTLKTIHLNIFKDVQRTVSSEKDLNERLQILQKHLLMCITVLKVLDSILECLFKNEQIDLGDVASVPLNVVDILCITFELCKNSNVLYKELSNTNDIVEIFKLAHEVHKKLLILMERHINDTVTPQPYILNSFLQFLVKIGKILSCMSMKAMADNWRGYLGISQKFSHVLNGTHTIKDSIQCLALEIEKNLRNLSKDTKKTQNLKSVIKLCNFLIKIIVKLCDVFLGDALEDWETLFLFFLNVYSYHPYWLRYNACLEGTVNEIEMLVFSPVDNLLERLCTKPEFCKMFIKCKKIHASSENCLLLIMNVLKKINSLLKTNVSIADIPQVIEIFFNVLSKGYFEFWKIILTTSNNHLLYEDNIKNMAEIIRLLPNEEYNEVECILFTNIFSASVWNCLMANDIWQLVLRNDARLSYETICNVIKLSEVHLRENFANRPQLIFLKNLLGQLARNLSENHKQLLYDRYPLDGYMHLWKTLGFDSVPKSEFGTIPFINTTMIHKSNLLINKRIILKDFKGLCDGLEALSLLTKNDKRKFSHLTPVLFDLWKFIFSNNWRDSFYSKYFIRKLILATNNLLLEFNNEQLLLILNKMRLLSDMDVELKILLSTSLTALSKKVITESQERNQIFTSISEIFFKLLTDRNQIIQQNTLEVFFLFDEVSEYDVIFQNVIKNDYELERRISNFVQKNIVDNKSLKWEEYFQLQSNYKFCHQCPQLPKIKNSKGLTHDELFSKTEDNRNEIDEVLERIRRNIELFYKLSGRHSMIKESTTEIMRILNK